VLLHYGGHPCDLDAVLELARARGIAVIEDAAHAVGASWKGRACGTFGDVGCFSFFSNKNLPTGEGGMVVTDDEELAGRIRLLRSHGMTTLTWDRHRGHAHSYDVVTHGYNYRLDEIRAAMGLVELRRLPEHNAARARIVEYYRTALHPPIHSFSAYASSERSRPLPVTDAVAARIVSLPLYAHMDVEQASEVVSAVLAAAP
jgi:dTDP-4-amino-4,6-dideoxygalactose transaminase